MKVAIFGVLSVSLKSALASPIEAPQAPFHLSALEEHLSTVPEGFSIDLDAERLVQFGPDQDPVWITEREKILAKANSLNFFDITNAPWVSLHDNRVAAQSYGSLNYTKKVKSVLKTLSTDGPKQNLAKFTSFRTRYYRSQSGRDSQLWLLQRLNEITAETASAELRSRIALSEFEHSWGQNSIIVKLKGTSSSKEGGAVIISAHQDSTNLFPFLPAPGADDDGSGTVTILEVYRALLASNYTPVHDVEWHFYSAEEGGLLGSQDVVKDYASRDAQIKAQLQFDMTAWVKKGTREEIGVITDFVDPKLTEYIKSLVDAYVGIPWVDSKCGYACSDHASWNKAGYPSAFLIESAFENSNQLIHSSSDRLDASPEFSFDHLLEFAKLGVAYVVETAGWA